MQTDPNLLNNARSLRRNMTEAEKKLWYMFLRKYPVRFRKQHITDSFVLDFYCAQAHLGIELDGGQHYEDGGIEKDAERTERLNAEGIDVLRYTNTEVLKHFDAVCEDIDREVRRRI